MNKKVEVTQLDDGSFQAMLEGSTGSPLVGRGASVLEAVGSYAIHHSLVMIQCKPFAVLNEYTIVNDYGDLKFKKPASRSD